jgi:hypothetical protein
MSAQVAAGATIGAFALMTFSARRPPILLHAFMKLFSLTKPPHHPLPVRDDRRHRPPLLPRCRTDRQPARVIIQPGDQNTAWG